MKLVDILARELKEWPEGVERLTQSQIDKELYQSFPDDHPMGANSLAPKVELETRHTEREPYPVVTRAEWQAAVDALNAGKPGDLLEFAEDYAATREGRAKSEWSGEGRPPVGIDVEIHNKTCRGVVDGAERFIGTNCKVLATFINVNGYEMVAVEDTAGACMCFRVDMCGPVRTPEQIAAETRATAIESAISLMPGEVRCKSLVEKAVGIMIDAGYSKIGGQGCQHTYEYNQGAALSCKFCGRG